MKKRISLIFTLGLVVILLLLACGLPTMPAVSAPSQTPGIGTIVAATAGAAQAQTLSAIPPTETPSSTPLPTHTPTETATPTATIILVMFASPTFTATLVETVGAGCQLIAQQPPNDTILAPKINFKAYWTIKNTGTSAWLDTSTDFLYQSGTDLSKKDIYDLPYTVGVGSEVTLEVAMKTPAKPGTYTTTWVLIAGGKTLCTLPLRIIVQ